MSESAVFTALGSVLGAVTVANTAPNVGRSTVKRVFTAVPNTPPMPADFPCWLIMRDPTATNRIALDSVGGARHTYQVVAYLLLTFNSTPFLEQQAIVQPWVEQMAHALNQARNLSGSAFAIWQLGSDTLADYSQAQISFSDSADYYGLRVSLAVTELID